MIAPGIAPGSVMGSLLVAVLGSVLGSASVLGSVLGSVLEIDPGIGPGVGAHPVLVGAVSAEKTRKQFKIWSPSRKCSFFRNHPDFILVLSS